MSADRDDGGGPIPGGRPPYAFVPGGPWPHPRSSPQGHSFGAPAYDVEPVGTGAWERSPGFVRGVALFNAGYYWEAHEAWEWLWHAHGRAGPTADVLKALIKLAAAGVKARERQPRGVSTHAARAAALFEAVRAREGPCVLGLDLDRLAALSRALAASPPEDPGPRAATVVRVIGFDIEPAGAKDAEDPRPA
jgi:hypothetical protein